MKKNTVSLIALIIIIIIIISLVSYLKNNNNGFDEKTAECVASKSKVYMSKTCSACAYQKDILKDYLDKFKIIDCTSEQDKCVEAEILMIPTWIINGEKFLGVKSLKELKSLTDC